MVRVVVHYMHEYEEAAANQLVRVDEATPAFLVGEIDESRISNLEAEGLIVEVLEAPPPATDAGLEGLLPGPPQTWPPEPALYELHLAGPLLDGWASELVNAGATLLEHRFGDRWLVRLDGASAAAVSQLGFVYQVTLERATRRVIAGLEGLGAPGGRTAAELHEDLNGSPEARESGSALTFDIVVMGAPGDLATTETWLQDRAVAIVGTGQHKIRVEVPPDTTVLDDLEGEFISANIEPFSPPELQNDLAREVVGLGNQSPIGQTGKGQIVAVADSGIDEVHPDFQGRITGVVARGRPNPPDASDIHGHGTHVAGTVLGDGAASQGRYRGAAPEAELFFQSILDAQGRLGGLPVDLGELLQEAYNAGARIHNNSWGNWTARADYVANSLEVDIFVAEHPDMLVVIAAGNYSQAAKHTRSQPGMVDYMSLSAPGTCKNALTVGASRSPRTQGGFAGKSHGQLWTSRFPNNPMAAELLGGDPEALAGFSGRGPAGARRIKPDIVAPGTAIASARSSTAPKANFNGLVATHYGYMSGTSMAAPLVSGAAALVRQYFLDQGTDPSAALLKATIINSAVALTGFDALADHQHVPNFNQGFGRLYMPGMIPNPSTPWLRLEHVDTWKSGNILHGTGDRFQRRYTVQNGGHPLRVCLAWTDPPPRGLQHNLNLIVEHEPTRKKWLGNPNLPDAYAPLDRENNIEVVRIDNAAAGDYLIDVRATNLLHPHGNPRQDFAIVVTGALV